MKNLEIVQESWLDFKKECLPKDAPPEVVRGWRRSFMAGALGLFSILRSAAEGTEQEQQAIMRLVSKELESNLKMIGSIDELQRL